MSFAFIDSETWFRVGFHAAVFVAVVVVVLGIQWLLDRKGGRG